MKKRIRDRIVSGIAFGTALLVGANALAETHQFVAFKNPQGIEYIFANNGGGQGGSSNLQTGYDTDFSEWYTFLLIGNDDGSVNIRTFDGSYFQTENDGVTRAVIIEDENNLPANTFYTPVDVGNGWHSAKASNGKYISVADYSSEHSLSFDGVDDFVEVTDESAFDFSTDFSVETWFKVDSFTKTWQTIISKGDDSWRIHRHDNNNTLNFAVNKSSGGYVEVSTARSVNDGQWHHVAAVADSSQQTLYLYLDGILESTTSFTDSINQSDYPVQIGANAQASGREFHGNMDEVRIWDVARSQAEIQSDMYNTSEGGENGLIAYYNFENDVASTVTDQSFNGYDGTLISSPTYATYAGIKNRYGLSFDSVDDSVEVADLSSAIAGQSNITLSAWVYPTSTNGNQGIAGFRNDTDAGFYLLQLDNSTQVEGRFSNSNGELFSMAPDVLTLNQWQHLSLTYDGSTLRLYHNGVLKDSVSASGTITNTSVDLYMGNLELYADPFNGQIDEVRLWNTTRSQSEIQANMNQVLAGTESGLVAYYDFENDVDSTVIDHSVNSYDGTLNGANHVSRERVLSTNHLEFNGDTMAFPVGLVNLEAPPVPANNRFVALHASVNKVDENGNDTSYEGFVAAEFGRGEYPQVNANRSTAGGWETFQFIDVGDGNVRLQAAARGNHLMAINGGGEDVQLRQDTGYEYWETFKVIRGLPILESDEVMFRTINNYYLNITPEGGLEATATTYGPETVFKVLEVEKPFTLSDGQVTIQAVRDVAEYIRTNYSNDEVHTASEWPRFHGDFNLYNNGDGSIYLQSSIDDSYLQAVNGGGEDIIHVQLSTPPASWERFEVVTGFDTFIFEGKLAPGVSPDDMVLLRSDSGHYLNIGSNGRLEATATNFHDAEFFVIATKEPEIPKERRVAIRYRHPELIPSYLSSDVAQTMLGVPYLVGSNTITDSTTFTLFEYDNGDVQLMAHDGKYLSNTENTLLADANEAHINETFRMIPNTEIASDSWADVVKFKLLNGSNCFNKGLYAGALSGWSFDTDCNDSLANVYIIDLDTFPISQLVYIRSKETGKYVAAEDDGSMTANRNTAGEWEIFLMTRTADNHISLKTFHGYLGLTSTEIRGDKTEPELFMLIENSDGSVKIDDSLEFCYTYQGIYSCELNYAVGFLKADSDTVIRVDEGVSLNTATNSHDFDIILVNEVGATTDIFDSNNNMAVPVLGTEGSETFTLENLGDVATNATSMGVVNSFTATADLLPNSLPDVGMLGVFKDMGGFSTPDAMPIRVDVHYNYGDQLDSNFPLNSELQYYDLKIATGYDARLGGVKIGLKNSETEIAVDHRSPAVFMYTNAPVLEPTPAEAVGIGISGKNNIPYEPDIADIPIRNNGDDTFNGAMWLNGTFKLPGLPKDVSDRVGITVTAGDIVLALDPDEVKAGGSIGGVDVLIPTNAIKQLGANASLDVTFNPCGTDDCPLELGFNLGEASMILNNENPSDPWLAISGYSEAGQPFDLPFGITLPSTPDMKMKVDVFVDKHNPYVKISGSYKSDAFGLPVGATVYGDFTIGTSGMSFDGKVKLSPALPEVSLSGNFTNSVQELTGELKTAFEGSVGFGRFCFSYGFGSTCFSIDVDWSIEGIIATHIGFDSGSPSFNFHPNLRGCVKGRCFGIGASAGFDNNRIKVCADLPVVGNQCGRI